MTQLIIAGANVRSDEKGHYSMNDLHKAAVAEGHDYKRTQVEHFMRNDSTKALIAELRKSGELEFDPCISSTGRYGGTWVSKEIVYAYAMWISAEFMLRVIRAYDALANGQLSEAHRIASRQNARLDFKPMTDALVLAREELGKATAAHHHMNEANLINRIAIGMTATQFKAEHGLPASAHLRDFLTELQMKCVEHLQRANTTMIEIGHTYEQRKEALTKIYNTRHAAGLLAEVQRLES